MESTERLPTPLERCAPLLLMLASFRASPPPDPEGVSAFRDRLLARLDGILDDAAADSRAHEPMHLLRPVLIYGIDGVVVATLGDRSPEWSRLEFDLIGTTEGGDRFFDLLENSTEHRDPAIREVFLALIQLGFRGRYSSREPVTAPGGPVASLPMPTSGSTSASRRRSLRSEPPVFSSPASPS
jgi:type VI protein secretion system component VasF